MREKFRQTIPRDALSLIHRFRLNPPQSVKKLAEQLGLGVVEIPMAAGEHGFLDRRPESGYPAGYVIYINESLSTNEKRWALAHELGHYFLHRDRRAGTFDPELHLDTTVWWGNPTEEHEANNFAEDLFFYGGALQAFVSLHGDDAVLLAEKIFGVPVERAKRAIAYHQKYRGLQV